MTFPRGHLHRVDILAPLRTIVEHILTQIRRKNIHPRSAQNNGQERLPVSSRCKNYRLDLPSRARTLVGGIDPIIAAPLVFVSALAKLAA